MPIPKLKFLKCHTEAAGKGALVRRPARLPAAVTLLSPAYFRIFPSSSFGLVDRGHRGLEENKTEDSRAETSNAVDSTRRRNSFSSVIVIHYSHLDLWRTAKRQARYSYQAEFAQAVTLLNCLRKRTGCARFESDAGHDYSEAIYGFPPSYQVNFRTAPDLKAHPLPSTPLSIHYTPSSKHSMLHTVFGYWQLLSVN